MENICKFQKVDRGWQIYFDSITVYLKISRERENGVFSRIRSSATFVLRVSPASAFQKDRPQNSKRSPFIPNKIKMTQFLVRVAYVFLFLTFKK